MYYGRGFYGPPRPMYGPPPPMYGGFYGPPPPMYGGYYGPPRYGGRIVYRSGCNVF